ncbi:MAG TPA: hypothetical protein VJS37_06330, partial [Terriglobales bacterium]|nr:hypothetical protein [Terriglobales bacterium]
MAHDRGVTLAAPGAVRQPFPKPSRIGHTNMLDALDTITQIQAPQRDSGDRQSLLKRLNLALRIARRTIQFLGATGFTGADLPEGNFLAEKPLAETAMLIHAAKEERSDPAVKDVFNALLQDLMPYARSKQMAWDVLRYPSVCLQIATPHILLGLLGFEDSQFDELLGRSAAACASRGHEVVPYRELEIIWLQSLWQNESPGGELEEIACKTALRNPIDLLHGTREDAYAHTHAIMYYTDFGNWQKAIPRPTEEFLGESEVVLARALIAEDYDLAAEALMAWPLTSSAWSPAAAFGFRVLASLEDKVGFLPAGRSASKRSLELAGDDKTKFALASSYHTAFVMGMLCALALRRETASPYEIAGPSSSPALIEDLQASIPKTGAYWEGIFQSLHPDEQAKLG